MDKKQFTVNGLACGVALLISTSALANSYDVRLSPLVLFVGAIDAEVNIGIGNHLTIAPMFTYYSADENSTYMSEEFSLKTFGARLYWHPKGVFSDGMYISPFARQWNFNITADNSLGTRAEGSISGTQIGATIGYLFQWDNFNMSLGIGASTFNFDQTYEATDSSGRKTNEEFDGPGSFSGISMDYSIGYAF